MIYLQNNVFDEALERLRMIFDGHDDVIVSMSGGKDSTVLFRMALMVAQERGRLPLKVFWLDQEAEWQATVDYMQHIMELPEVTPYWYQIPFEFTNTLSPEKNFISVWNPEDKAIWIHPQHPLSIKENPSSENRFHELVNVLPSHCTDSENCAVLVGMRMTESLNRRVAITQHEARYKGVTWCKKKVGRCQVFWPIYDFTNDDIWTAIAKNHWSYNRVYDLQYQWGLAKEAMRVSALIHETAWQTTVFLSSRSGSTMNCSTRSTCSTLTLILTLSPLVSQLPAMTLMPTPFSMMGWSVNPKRTAVPDTKPIWIAPQRKKHRMLQSPRRSK